MKKLYSEKEAAEYLSMSRSYLRQDRMNGKVGKRTPGPKYCRFGKMIRYTQEALDRWIETNTVNREKTNMTAIT